MTPTAYALPDGLALVHQTVPHTPSTRMRPTHHIVVLDCSGSMAAALPAMRAQLKDKLVTLLRKEDRLSLIWFSGKGQVGTLVGAIEVPGPDDLRKVHAVIDRWLQPVGMTGFVEPLHQAFELAAGNHSRRMPVSLFFLSDGYDNQWGRAEILKAVHNLRGPLAAATVVEFGMYADHALLTTMAETFGGTLVGAADFAAYAPVLEGALAHRAVGHERTIVDIDPDYTLVGNVAFALVDRTVRTYALGDHHAVEVQKDVQEVWLVTDDDSLARARLAPTRTPLRADACYAAAGVFAARMRPAVVRPLLRALGDARFVRQYATCFGRQRYAAFVAAVTAAAFDPALRDVDGRSDAPPPDDAFTLLDLLRRLAADPDARLLLDDPAFRYNRIGRAQLDATEHLTVAERATLATLEESLRTETNGVKIAEIAQAMAALTADKTPGLKFVADSAPDGYPVDGLVLNESRPNVSVRVTKPGVVRLVDDDFRWPSGTPTGTPPTVATQIIRSYTIVKDGIVHVDKLPVRLPEATYMAIAKEYVRAFGRDSIHGSDDGEGRVRTVLDLAVLPLLTQKRVAAVSAETFFRTHVALLRAQAAQKVYNWYAKTRLPARRSDGLADKHGADVAAWLATKGIRDDGFNPPRTAAPVRDVYLGKELKVSIKGYSSFPKIEDVLAKMAFGPTAKLNGPMTMMRPTVVEVTDFLATKAVARQLADGRTNLLEAWLDEQKKRQRTATRALLHTLAETTFAIVVGQVWFREFASLDENAMDIVDQGETFRCKVEPVDIRVEL